MPDVQIPARFRWEARDYFALFRVLQAQRKTCSCLGVSGPVCLGSRDACECDLSALETF